MTTYILLAAVIRTELMLFYWGHFFPHEGMKGSWCNRLSPTSTHAAWSPFFLEMVGTWIYECSTGDLNSLMNQNRPNAIVPNFVSGSDDALPQILWASCEKRLLNLLCKHPLATSLK